MGVEPNWGLLGNAPNIGQSFQQGMAMGRQQAIQVKSDNALAAVQKDPTDTNALGTLAIYNPAAANSVIQMRGIQRQEAQRSALAASYNPDTGGVDYGAAAAKLAATGDGAGAAELAQKGQAAQVARLEFQQKVTSNFLQNLDAGDLADDTHYKALLARTAPQWKAAGLPVPTWLPQSVEGLTSDQKGELFDSLQAHALTAAEQIKQRLPDQKQFGNFIFEDGKPKYRLPPTSPYMPVAGMGVLPNPAAVNPQTGQLYGLTEIGASGGGAGPPAGAPSPAAPVPAPQGVQQPPPERAAMLRAIWNQESGNTPGVTGPSTPYGHALGIGQTLPATAHAMANKIGLPWRPDLLTGKTDEAAQYQRALSAAYLDEAAHAAGGYNEDAAKYYFAGPNHALWGKKTHQYGQDVMGRMAADPKYASASAGAPEATAAINGKTYVRVNGKWFDAAQQQAAAQPAAEDGGDE